MSDLKYTEHFCKESNVLEDGDEKTVFNRLMREESYYKAQVDEFLNSAPPEEIVVVLINFCAIGGGRDMGVVIPGEIALTAFSLKEGIIDNCALMINHGKDLPERAIQTLNTLLELPKPIKENNNYGDAVWILNLFRKKYRYGRGKNQNALLFCRTGEHSRVTHCLNFLFEARGGDEYGFQVFPLEYLVLKMAAAVYAKDIGESNVANVEKVAEILDSDDYKKLTRLACLHHHKTRTGHIHCPLKTVSRHAYNIIGSLMHSSMSSPGSHYPSRQTEEREICRRQHQIMTWITCTPHRISFPIAKSVLEDDEKFGMESNSSVNDNESCGPNSNVGMTSNMRFPQNLPHGSQTQNQNYQGWNPYMPFAPPFGPGFYPYPPPMAGQQPFPYQWPQTGKCTSCHQNQMPYYPMMPYGTPPRHKPSGQIGQSPMDPAFQSTQPGNFNSYPNPPTPFFSYPTPNYSPARGPQRASRFENQDLRRIQRSVERLSIEPNPDEPSASPQMNPPTHHPKGRPG